MAPLDEVNRSPLDLIYECVGLGSGKMKLIVDTMEAIYINFQFSCIEGETGKLVKNKTLHFQRFLSEQFPTFDFIC